MFWANSFIYLNLQLFLIKYSVILSHFLPNNFPLLDQMGEKVPPFAISH